MANSERSFADRLQKAENLKAIVSTMMPVYAPLNSTVTIVNIAALLTLVSAANIAVGNSKTQFTNKVPERLTLADSLPKLATRIVNYVKSGPAWELEFPRIKELCDKVRRVNPPRKTLPPPAPQPGEPTPPLLKPRDRGDGSYAELAENFTILAAAVTSLPGYAPDDPDLAAVTLNALGPQLESRNNAVGLADTALDKAQRARFRLYFTPKTGLKDVFADIKQAVKAQYGQDSTQYEEVKGIRW